MHCNLHANPTQLMESEGSGNNRCQLGDTREATCIPSRSTNRLQGSGNNRCQWGGVGGAARLCVCSRVALLLVRVPACYEEKSYDPDNLWESEVAKDLQLPWDLRGPRDGRPSWKGQALRPSSGRYANRGGWKKRVMKVYRASGRDEYYSLANPNGPNVACIQHASTCACAQRRGNNRAYMQPVFRYAASKGAVTTAPRRTYHSYM